MKRMIELIYELSDSSIPVKKKVKLIDLYVMQLAKILIYCDNFGHDYYYNKQENTITLSWYFAGYQKDKADHKVVVKSDSNRGGLDKKTVYMHPELWNMILTHKKILQTY
jgi:hypothetical protein